MKFNFSLKLHRGQLKVFNEKKQFKLLVCGRRWGKSRLLLTSAIHAALAFNQKIDPASPPIVLIAMPTLKQARAIHWKPLYALLRDAPFVEEISKSDFRIILKGNKPDIILRGCNDDGGDNLRGLKIYAACLDEFQDIKPVVWEEVIYPALADTKNSSALICATPKGKTHPLYKFHTEAKGNKDWGYYHFVTKDNPFIPKLFLKKAQISLPPKVFRQEMEASFEDFEGQIFDQLADRHYFSEVPSNLTYYLGADWGDQHPALVVIGLTKDYSKFYIVDGWYNQINQPVVLDDFLKKMSDFCKQYNIYRSYLPDDRPASVIAARKTGKINSLPGLTKAVQVNRNEVGVLPGIEIINSLFYQDRLFIKSSLTSVREQFQDYHRETAPDGSILNKVAPNQKDHLVDAARYCLVTLYNKIEKLK